ncbi:MAG: hypothetical protein EXR71_18305 [Myxococcales bacterium]|nr:hypothetical protein [Myxococcales bacterium]
MIPAILAFVLPVLAEEPRADTRVTWVAIPNVGYDVDDGLGLGAIAEIDWYEPGYDPYQLAFVAQAFATTNGYHHHRIRFDAPGLGAAHTLRLTGHFAYRQWLNDGYWGLGNDTTVSRAAFESTEGDLTKRYRYTLVQPFGRLTLRGELGGPWAWFAFLAGRWSAVETYEGSLLGEDAAIGMEGGWGIQPGVGLLYDTREPELTPGGGVLLELSARGMPPLPGAEGSWVAAFASARAYWTLGPKVVLASRVMGEAMWGEVPFYDLNTWGGLTPTMGIGGSDSARGISFGRWRDANKVAVNNELRIDLFRHVAFSREIRWQLVPFVDAVCVFGTGESETEPLGAWPVHPGAGLGIHPVVEDTFVGRLDVAVGLDQVEEADGGRTTVPNLGVYVVFDHML